MDFSRKKNSDKRSVALWLHFFLLSCDRLVLFTNSVESLAMTCESSSEMR